MNSKTKLIYLYLLFSFTFLSFGTDVESLEDRKKRIMRKYLRQKSTVYQSDIIIKNNQKEDSRVTESEMMLVDDNQYERQNFNEKVVNPYGQHSRFIQQQMHSNWMLDNEYLGLDEIAEDGNLESIYGMPNATFPANTTEQIRSDESRVDIFGRNYNQQLQNSAESLGPNGYKAIENNENSNFEIYSTRPNKIYSQNNSDDIYNRNYNNYTNEYEISPSLNYQKRLNKEKEAEIFEYSPVKKYSPKNKRWDPAGNDYDLQNFIDKNQY